ncbi:hypothetical protein ACTFIV_003999 [Dictyostelium citrinum]
MNIKYIVLGLLLFVVASATAKYTCECNFSHGETRLIAVKDKSHCFEKCNSIIEEVYTIPCNLQTCTCKCTNGTIFGCQPTPTTSSTATSTGKASSSGPSSTGKASSSGPSSTGKASSSGPSSTSKTSSSTQTSGSQTSGSQTSGSQQSGSQSGQQSGSQSGGQSGQSSGQTGAQTGSSGSSGGSGSGSGGGSGSGSGSGGGSGSGSGMAIKVDQCAGTYCPCNKQLLSVKVL